MVTQNDEARRGIPHYCVNCKRYYSCIWKYEDGRNYFDVDCFMWESTGQQMGPPALPLDSESKKP